MKITSLLLILLLFIAGISRAQRPDIRFNHITTKEGLSQSSVTCILQDSKGYMWFGTYNGLNRYDGYQLKIFKHDPNVANTISSSRIQDLLEDRQGNLWVATADGGLNKFNRKTETFSSFQFNPSQPESLSNNSLNALLEDKEGNLWIATSWGLNKMNKGSNTFVRYLHEPENEHSLIDNTITDVLEDEEGNIWVGTMNGGLDLFDQERNIFIHHKHEPGNPSALNHNHVRSLLQDSKGRLWVGTNEGLNLWNSQQKTFHHFGQEPTNQKGLNNKLVLSMAEDANGRLWVGTENGGINILEQKKNLFHYFPLNKAEADGLNCASIHALYKDRNKNMWVGTFDGGVNWVDRQRKKFRHFKSNPNTEKSLQNDYVSDFAEEPNGHVWVGTGRGLSLFDPQKNTFAHFLSDSTNSNSLANNFLTGLHIDRENNLWAGSWGAGITKVSPDRKVFTRYQHNPEDPGSISSNYIKALTEDNEGNIWIGTVGSGLNRFDRQNNKFSHYNYDPSDSNSISSNYIGCLLVDSRGNLWVGTEGDGLNLYDPERDHFKHFKADEQKAGSLSYDFVHTIFEDSKGNIWVGTSFGLNRYDRQSGSFVSYWAKQGLAGNTVKSIQEDDHGNLWIGTHNGISKFNPESNTFSNFSPEDGLQGYEFNNTSLKSSSGEIYFSGTNGFNVFHPDSIHNNPIVPPVYITNFQVFNQEVSAGEGSLLETAISESQEIILSHEESVFSFDFASLNFSLPQENEYAYMMEGFDSDWQKVGNKRSATYTNLDPGHYTFRVKASNNDGLWNEEGTALSVIITPPYWQSWWFRLLSIILLGGSVVGFYFFRIHRIKTQKDLLEKQVQERTFKIEQQNEKLLQQAQTLQLLNQELKGQKEVILLGREEAEKARKEAERANQAKSTFLATMSHEIRTPMNGVIGMTSLLSETALNPEQKQFTEIIRSSGESLLSIINDVLDFSKIESDMIELEEQDFDLRQCIEEVMDLFTEKAAKKGVDLIYQIDQQVPIQIVGDSHRLRQVLINLVGNAIKFTEKGEIFVGVKLLELNKGQLRLSFQVQDTGIGIPEEHLPYLFRAFSQADSSTTRKFGGTGLGLAISKRLVELMGGEMTVESQLSRGSTFTFSMQSQLGSQAIRQYVTFNSRELEGKKILLVDDNATNLKIMKNQLEQWKIIPTLSTSGEDALSVLSHSAEFDLVITDMQMPEMDGVQLAQAIKEQYPGLPVFLLSSIGKHHSKAFSDLFAAVLSKPVKQQQLWKLILLQLKPNGNLKLPANPLVQEKLLNTDFAEKHPLRILVAEDNMINQMLAEMLLSRLGYKPKMVQNGREVLAVLKHQAFDVILMDIQMPEMDGLEATQAIRKKEDKQPLIIAMTANAMKEDREKCLSTGMDDYLSKPIKVELLKEALAKASEKVMSLAKQE